MAKRIETKSGRAHFMSWHSEVRSRPRYYFDFLDNEDFVKECLYAADPSVLVDIGYLPPGSDPSATASILGADCPMLLRRSQPSSGYFSQPSQVVVRREPSRVAFISIVRRSTFRAELRTFQKEWSCERIELSWALR
jgi:hypothetical protein